MTMEKESEQALLPERPDEDSDSDHNHWRYEAIIRKKYLRRFAVVQLLLSALYAAGVGILLRKDIFIQIYGAGKQHLADGEVGRVSSVPGLRGSDEFVYSPAAEVDKFEPTMLNMHLYKDNPYKGPPTPEVDEAWDKLFENSYIRLSQSELARLGRNSTPIPDDSGDYMGALDVYHQLHCVRFIFQYVHQDYYTLQKINVPKKDHINHCIDVLRQIVMCYADTSISTMTFYDHYYKAWPQFKFEHSCRNWEAVDAWAGLPGRAIDQSDPERIESWLRNPNFVNTGKYFDGHGEDD